MSRRGLMKLLLATLAPVSFNTALLSAEPESSGHKPITSPNQKARKAVYIAPNARRHGKFAQIAFKMASEDTAGLLGSTELV